MNQRGERGSIMIVVMVILTALLSAGVVAIYIQFADTKTTGLIRSARDSLYCAEAGLARAAREVGERFNDWPLILDADPDNDPDWYPIEIDLDGEPPDVDVVVRVMDNDDETPPADNDPTNDKDLRLFLVSKCEKFPETPREIVVLLLFEGIVFGYADQAGQGALSTGNIGD